MKYFIAIAVSVAAGAAYADGNAAGGMFGGGVSTFAGSGGASATGSWGGDVDVGIRNESGSGEFAGAGVTWENDGSSVTITGESFTDGFNFSSTEANGGYGGSFAANSGIAGTTGVFGGGFFSGEFDADDGFPGLGLGHDGFDDGTPGNSDKWD